MGDESQRYLHDPHAQGTDSLDEHRRRLGPRPPQQGVQQHHSQQQQSVPQEQPPTHSFVTKPVDTVYATAAVHENEFFAIIDALVMQVLYSPQESRRKSAREALFPLLDFGIKAVNARRAKDVAEFTQKDLENETGLKAFLKALIDPEQPVEGEKTPKPWRALLLNEFVKRKKYRGMKINAALAKFLSEHGMSVYLESKDPTTPTFWLTKQLDQEKLTDAEKIKRIKKEGVWLRVHSFDNDKVTVTACVPQSWVESFKNEYASEKQTELTKIEVRVDPEEVERINALFDSTSDAHKTFLNNFGLTTKSKQRPTVDSKKIILPSTYGRITIEKLKNGCLKVTFKPGQELAKEKDPVKQKRIACEEIATVLRAVFPDGRVTVSALSKDVSENYLLAALQKSQFTHVALKGQLYLSPEAAKKYDASRDEDKDESYFGKVKATAAAVGTTVAKYNPVAWALDRPLGRLDPFKPAVQGMLTTSLVAAVPGWLLASLQATGLVSSSAQLPFFAAEGYGGSVLKLFSYDLSGYIPWLAKGPGWWVNNSLFGLPSVLRVATGQAFSYVGAAPVAGLFPFFPAALKTLGIFFSTEGVFGEFGPTAGMTLAAAAGTALAVDCARHQWRRRPNYKYEDEDDEDKAEAKEQQQLTRWQKAKNYCAAHPMRVMALGLVAVGGGALVYQYGPVLLTWLRDSKASKQNENLDVSDKLFGNNTQFDDTCAVKVSNVSRAAITPASIAAQASRNSSSSVFQRAPIVQAETPFVNTVASAATSPFIAARTPFNFSNPFSPKPPLFPPVQGSSLVMNTVASNTSLGPAIWMLGGSGLVLAFLKLEEGARFAEEMTGLSSELMKKTISFLSLCLVGSLFDQAGGFAALKRAATFLPSFSLPTVNLSVPTETVSYAAAMLPSMLTLSMGAGGVVLATAATHYVYRNFDAVKAAGNQLITTAASIKDAAATGFGHAYQASGAFVKNIGSAATAMASSAVQKLTPSSKNVTWFVVGGATFGAFLVAANAAADSWSSMLKIVTQVTLAVGGLGSVVYNGKKYAPQIAQYGLNAAQSAFSVCRKKPRRRPRGSRRAKRPQAARTSVGEFLYQHKGVLSAAVALSGAAVFWYSGGVDALMNAIAATMNGSPQESVALPELLPQGSVNMARPEYFPGGDYCWSCYDHGLVTVPRPLSVATETGVSIFSSPSNLPSSDLIIGSSSLAGVMYLGQALLGEVSFNRIACFLMSAVIALGGNEIMYCEILMCTMNSLFGSVFGRGECDVLSTLPASTAELSEPSSMLQIAAS